MTQTNAARFASREDAAQAAAKFPPSLPRYVSPAYAKFEGVKAGWYIGYDPNISRRLVTEAMLASR